MLLCKETYSPRLPLGLRCFYNVASPSLLPGDSLGLSLEASLLESPCVGFYGEAQTPAENSNPFPSLGGWAWISQPPGSGAGDMAGLPLLPCTQCLSPGRVSVRGRGHLLSGS